MFKKIIAKNLFSWENLEYNIPTGVSQIVGFNHDDQTPEGSGKSAVLNTLCWTLFGKIPKDAKIDEVVREGQKGAVGKVILSDGTEIIRKRKPNDLLIRGINQEFRGKDAKETQAMIIDLIGMDFDTFCQTIYFAQNYPKKFITASESEKAKILSEIQDLSIFDRARERAREQVKDYQERLQKEEVRVAGIRSQLTGCLSKKEFVEDVIERFEDDRTSRLCKVEEELDMVTGDIAELSEIITEDSKLALKESLEQRKEMGRSINDHINQAKASILIHRQKAEAQERGNKRFGTIMARIVVLDKKLESFENEKVCPTCSGPITEEQANNIFDERGAIIKEIEELIEERDFIVAESESIKPGFTTELERLVEEALTEKATIETELARLQQELTDYEILSNSLSQLHSRSLELKREKDKLSVAEPNKELETLEEVLLDIKQLDYNLTELTECMEGYRIKIRQFESLKDGFKEVKSYIFQEFLAILSSESTNFAQEMFELPISIEFFNESKAGGISKIHTQVTLNGVPRSLGLYSGGQARRIQLAVDLALAKIVGQRSKNPINFRILDEGMKDLSSTSMEKVVELLKNLDGTTVMIEHNPIVKSIVNSTFEVELRDGISRHAS